MRLPALLLVIAFPGMALGQQPDVVTYPDEEASAEPEVILDPDRMPGAQDEGQMDAEVIPDDSGEAAEPEPQVLRGTEPAVTSDRAARVSFLQGDVSFQGEDSRSPEDVVLNQPFGAGDRLLTEQDAKAELTLGVAAVRLDERTDLSVSALDENRARFELNSGTLSVHVREMQSGERLEIETPNSTIRLLRPGEYRVEVPRDGSTILAVRGGGDAEIDSDKGEGPVRVQDLQQARLAAGERFAAFQEIGRRDAFEEWSRDRERDLMTDRSPRYVSRDIVGYEDLDRYGEWYSEPDYGYVWAPSHVVIGWQPYYFGRWRWLSHWGWTWIDDAPWGFAPFHYGRWHFIRNRWCWVPPPRFHHHRHTWHPGYHHSRPSRPWKGYASNNFGRDHFVRNGIRAGIERGNGNFRSGNSDGRFRTRPELGQANLGAVTPRLRGERPDYRRGEDRRLTTDPSNRERWARPDRPGGRHLRNEDRWDRNRERPRTERPPGDGRLADRPRYDRPRYDRPGNDRPRFDQPRVDRPRYDRPGNDRPRVDQPRVDRPRYDRPGNDRPRFDQPRVDRPRYDRPRYDRPGNDRPRFDQPRVDRPRYDRPGNDRPRFDQPRVDRPRYDRPRYDRPGNDRPRFDQPRVDRPRFDRPRFDQPRVDRPDYNNRPRYDRPRSDRPSYRPHTPQQRSVDSSRSSMRSAGAYSAPRHSSGGGGGRYQNGRVR